MIKLKGNVPSSKNSKQWTGNALISSKTVRNYLKNYEFQYKIFRNDFKKLLLGKEKPYFIGFYFIRDSKRKFDYHNAVQLPFDLMVKHGWIDDDNITEVNGINLGYEVNKNNAGVIITVLDNNFKNEIDKVLERIKNDKAR